MATTGAAGGRDEYGNVLPDAAAYSVAGGDPLQVAAEAPAEVEPGPTGVLLGAGGDPLAIGIPLFIVGSLALGLVLVGVVPVTAVTGIAPILLAGTGLFHLITALWAIVLGQSLVAEIFGMFAGFWLSYPVLLLGLNHNWFAVPAADIAGVEEIFYVCWAAVFLILTIVCLRLPVIYPAIIGLVVVALALATAATATGSVQLLQAAGAAVLAFVTLGFVSFLNVGSLAGGGPARPSVGQPIIK